MNPKSIIRGASVLFSLASVTVALAQTSPGYTLLPSTNLWDGRQTFTVTPVVTNMAALGGATNFTYAWTVDGVAVTAQNLFTLANPGLFTDGILTLLRAQGTGPMTVTLALSNGGTPVTNRVTVPVQQPATDSWVQRVPGPNEQPVNMQFYARDNTGYGTIYYNGTIAGSPSSVFLNVYANGVLYTNLSQVPSGGAYALSARILGGLVTYSVQFGSVTGTTTNILNTVTNLVCGDAYILEGQSNTQTPIGGEVQNGAASVYTNYWIRSYGVLGGGTTGGWGYATRQDAQPEIGYWGMDLAINLWATYNMPICIINGAVGGTWIVRHQPNPTNHLAANALGASLGSIYANLLARVQAAGLTHGIRGVLWHQGEQNQGTEAASNTGFPGPDYLYYQKHFVTISGAWKQDFPNIQDYYIFQIWPAACGDTADNDMLREVQRTLPRLYSNMRIMSTLGVVPGSGCHFVPAGYQMFSDLISPLVKQDNYGYVPASEPSAPNLVQAYYTTGSKNEIALVFNQDMAWNNPNGSPNLNNFFMDYVNVTNLGTNGVVTSGSASGNVLKLSLSASSSYQTVTYKVGSQGSGPFLYGSNGVAALTFCSVPIQASASPGLYCLPASSITTTSAVINATLACAGTNYAVNAYWNTVNGGSSASLWSNSRYVGAWNNVSSTNVSFSANGLLTGTTYYYSFEGTNGSGPLANLWSYIVRSFTTQVGAPGPVVDTSAGAANVSVGVSQLRGTLSNAPADLYVFWGTQDWGTSQVNWTNGGNVIVLTNPGSGAFGANASNLLYGLTYYYRCFSSNQFGIAWSPSTTSFTSMAPGTPASLTNASPTAVTGYSANLNAVLSCTQAVEYVTVYWGTANGGTNAGAWASSAYLGAWTNVTGLNLSYNAGGLTPATNYYFTFVAVNALGALWATNVQSFTTPSTLLSSAVTNNGIVVTTFTGGSGPWTPPAGINKVAALVVGGGGGGGADAGGGGGAGGVIYSNRFGVSGSFRVTVGSGGVGAGTNGNGQNSVFSSLTAIGGGGGGGWQPAGSGGSGGGGGMGASWGNGTPGQGNRGAPDQGYYSGAGGGGAGGPGMTGFTTNGGYAYNGGNGGIGVQNSISGSAQWYAGGGGGGANSFDGGTSALGGTGGSGGGGRGGQGASGLSGLNGTSNTGGGGGGGDRSGGGSTGGSGVIIISYSLVTNLWFTSLPSSPTQGAAFSVTVQAQDNNGNAKNVTADTAVQLSVASGSGALSGTTSGTIASGNSSVTISGVIYSGVDTMTLQATATSGTSLTPVVSSPIAFSLSPVLAYSSATVGSNTVVTFTSGSGTWTPPGGVSSVAVLVVGGGGAGGTGAGGGGGAGGVIYSSSFGVSGAVTVTVGQGGGASANGATNGANSVFSSLTAIGGGHGACGGDNKFAPGNGGSGGGASYNYNGNVYGNGTSGQGNNGGSASSGNYDGAGGGGAGAVGGQPNYFGSQTVAGGNGGNGVQYSISGSAQWYGGGGGGGANDNDGGSSCPGGSGGLGGGGNGGGPGGWYTAGYPGTPNTGGGGGGGVHVSGIGAAGGSGVVIISFPASSGPAVNNGSGETNASPGAGILRGTLTNGPANVIIYWGPVDAGSSAGTWANVILLTNTPNGAFSASVSNLLYGVTYYYRCYASNTNGTAWAPASTNFLSLRPSSGCSLTNTSANAIGSGSASLNATLGCAGAAYSAYAFWNTVNAGTNASQWTNSAYVGSWTNLAATNLGYTATGLAAGTTWYFTFLATNVAESSWATNVQSFITLPPPPPGVDNAAGAANLSVGVAQLRGTLAYGPADVRLYWGASDGGTNAGNWPSVNLVTGVANGSFSSTASNLFYGLIYYYRCCASNQWGVAWSPATASFTTLKPVVAAAVQIPYSNLVEVSASSQYGGYPATNAFNGAGLQANGTHTTSGNWFSSGTAAVTNEWLKVRFDQSYTLDHLRVWAFNGGMVTPAVTNADVYVINSATDPAGNVNLGGGPFKTNGWSLLLPQQYFVPSASVATETNTDPGISLGGGSARQLALKINKVVSGNYAGFAEVQIYQSPPVLTLNNLAASGVGSASATLNATLGCTGAVYQVYAYWNTLSGGTNAGLWTNSAYVGSWTNIGSASLSYTATGLAPSTAYYFTFSATNVVDTLWAGNVQSFTTLAPAIPPTPVLPVGGVAVTNGVPSFSFTAAVGCMYRLDYKNALTDSVWAFGPWSTNTSGKPLPMTLTDTGAAGQAQRFYRLEAAIP